MSAPHKFKAELVTTYLKSQFPKFEVSSYFNYEWVPTGKIERGSPTERRVESAINVQMNTPFSGQITVVLDFNDETQLDMDFEDLPATAFYDGVQSPLKDKIAVLRKIIQFKEDLCALAPKKTIAWGMHYDVVALKIKTGYIGYDDEGKITITSEPNYKSIKFPADTFVKKITICTVEEYFADREKYAKIIVDKVVAIKEIAVAMEAEVNALAERLKKEVIEKMSTVYV